MNFAPIALFVYNRPWHTCQTLEALRENPLANESLLYVFSDGPRSTSDFEKIQEVRDCVRRIKGFRQVYLIEREVNYGLAGSLIDGITKIVNEFGKVIVLEDDMVSSEHFIAFMNDALDFYKNDERVINIHGYIYPLGVQLPETFFLKDTGCWGWATWKRGWNLFEPDGKKLLEELEYRNLAMKFDLNGAYPFTQMLRDQIARKNDSWAIRWQASAFLQNRLTLFPGRSMIRNIGHDDSGVHCGTSWQFDVLLSDARIRVGSIPVEENARVLGELERYLRGLQPGFRTRMLLRIKEIFDQVRG